MSIESIWNHLLCEECWALREPNRVPVRAIAAEPEPCCVCGFATGSGIYVRVDPREMPCGGARKPHEVTDNG